MTKVHLITVGGSNQLEAAHALHAELADWLAENPTCQLIHACEPRYWCQPPVQGENCHFASLLFLYAETETAPAPAPESDVAYYKYLAPLRVGDCVVCVDNSHSGGDLMRGMTYRVIAIEISATGILGLVVEGGSSCWAPRRFRKPAGAGG